MLHWLSVLSFVILGFNFSANGKVFKNSYIQFEMPSQWNCQLKKRAYLCRHKISKSCQVDTSAEGCAAQVQKSREAVVVIAAKTKSSLDSLEVFKNHFGEAKKIQGSKASSSQSKVIHNKFVGIKKLQWVDTMHLGSEIPQYYTRYLSTINGDVAILISFSAHKKFYTNYSNQFFKGIKSLKVRASKSDSINSKELGQQILSQPIDLSDELFDEVPDQTEATGGDLSSLLFGLAMILLALGIYIWIKRKK